jgi:hypothetical protein
MRSKTFKTWRCFQGVASKNLPVAVTASTAYAQIANGASVFSGGAAAHTMWKSPIITKLR